MTEEEALVALYAALDGGLPSVDGNPCGDCDECCTGRGLSMQNVAEIELAALRDRYGKARADDFRMFSERRCDERGELLHETCPFHDRTAPGCGIYTDRPYSCRVFGHYRMAGTRLPDGCVFEGRVQEVDQGGYFRTVPQARRLRELQRAWDARQPHPRIEGPPAQDLLERVRRNIDVEDPVDLALVAQMEGRLEDALGLLEQALTEHPDDASLHMGRGNLLDELGRTLEARSAYERSLALDPGSPRGWIHLGFNRVELGDAVGGRDAFARAVLLQPEDATARGFLGWLTFALAQTMDEIRKGGDHLAEAIRLDPLNALFRVRLAEALLVQGRAQEGLPHLEAAEADERTSSAGAGLRARFASLLTTE